ncbi:uncharacterized protein LOC117785456 isoform X7 [Drosophila innubila]|uniref:uncharacterized protein LOC117785456 isoform X7 n=1 Tax=Drosophila innubila TaxID=198719 RepID=UPI00148B8E36|nr:uncharacterized protein LOC117785456 isoform X7 [Drosophila innubila]
MTMIIWCTFKAYERSKGHLDEILQQIPRRNVAADCNDRQNNSLELGRQQSRYGDIFFIEPNSPEAARIREQLEKDEKDLPSYDEVMRMCNLTTPTAAAALPTPPPPPIESTSIGIAALPAPPYTENDPHPNAVVIDANAVTPSPLESTPSTSRAAQIQIA